MKDKKVIIFGATGAVGGYTAIELKQQGYDVICVGRRKSDNGFFEDHGMEYISADITNKDDYKKIPKKNIGSVLHFAGMMPSKMAGYNPQEYIDSIVTGTYNVLEYCRNVDAEKIVFTQTRADSSHLMGSGKPIPSDIERRFPPTGDHAMYTICKNTAVDMIEHYYHEYGLRRFTLRLPTIYSAHPNKYFYVNGEKKVKAYRQLIEQAAKGEAIEVWGNPNKAKEITYVKDLVQIVRLSIESTIDGGVYNVGRGVGVTLEEQIKGIVEVFSPKEKASEIVYRSEKPDGREFVHDITKTQKELGYQPAYTYKDMLEDMKKDFYNRPFAQLWGSV